MGNGEPKPRNVRLQYEGAKCRVSERRNLPVPQKRNERSFFDVIENRRSRRSFGLLSDAHLGSLLWYTAKTIRTLDSWESRMTPSAGGIHPVDILIVDVFNGFARARLYDSMAHALSTILDTQGFAAQHLLNRVNEVVEIQEGVAVVFAAQFGKTRAAYENADSLVWRDAGALVCSFYMVCESIGLNCCALGATCASEVSDVLGSSLYSGVGGCVVGSK
ncbi:nitroreductase family protein [Roseiconus lacunae]|uniref:nitroreductase family protein n=1 Tax=Roseiconus lacunae TaxID=2605694 RepID=UPI0036F310B0